MKQVGKVLMILALFVIGDLKAQDIHFSQFNMSPLSLNPANTGAFEGSFRIGGIYRDQFRGIISQPFTTPMFYIDAPLAIGKNSRDWIGVGGMLYQDKVGAAGLKTSSGQLSVAYHHTFDDDYKTVLTLGVQGGPVSRRIDINNSELNFEDEVLVGGGFGPTTGFDRQKFNDNGNYFDLSTGIKLRTEINDKSSLQAGIAFGHLLNSNVGFGAVEQLLNTRIQLHAAFTRRVTEKLQISPSIYFTNLSPANQLQLQALAGYSFNDLFRFNFGLGYRFSDAGEILLGADYKNIKVGLSYDFTVSELRNVNTSGAFELAVGYIFKIYKETVVKPVILCPHL